MTSEVPLITCEELKQIGANLPTNKAPGPDGVPDVILKHITDRKPELILGIINKCPSGIREIM